MSAVQLEVELELYLFISIQKYSQMTKKLIQSKMRPSEE